MYSTGFMRQTGRLSDEAHREKTEAPPPKRGRPCRPVALLTGESLEAMLPDGYAYYNCYPLAPPPFIRIAVSGWAMLRETVAHRTDVRHPLAGMSIA